MFVILEFVIGKIHYSKMTKNMNLAKVNDID